MYVGLIQVVEGLNRTKRWWTEELALHLTELGYQSSPSLGLEIIPLAPWFSGLRAWTENISLTFLGLQVRGGRLWNFSYNQSIFFSVPYPVYILFLWRILIYPEIVKEIDKWTIQMGPFPPSLPSLILYYMVVFYPLQSLWVFLRKSWKKCHRLTPVSITALINCNSQDMEAI